MKKILKLNRYNLKNEKVSNISVSFLDNF